MRIHSDRITLQDISNAAGWAKTLTGTAISSEVSAHGSRRRGGAYEVFLYTFEKQQGDGRQRPQHQGLEDVWSVTWEEWGWFISELYRFDPDAIVGPYPDHAEFDVRTEHKFNTAA